MLLPGPGTAVERSGGVESVGKVGMMRAKVVSLYSPVSLPPSLTTHHLIGSICFYQSDYRLDWTGAGLLVFYAHHFHRA